VIVCGENAPSNHKWCIGINSPTFPEERHTMPHDETEESDGGEFEIVESLLIPAPMKGEEFIFLLMLGAGGGFVLFVLGGGSPF
jgi:hypothetical protein